MKVGRPIIMTSTAICFKDYIKIYSFLIGFQRSYLITLQISLSHTGFGIMHCVSQTLLCTKQTSKMKNYYVKYSNSILGVI